MFKKDYKSLYEQINPSEQLLAQTIRIAQHSKSSWWARHAGITGRWKMPALAAGAFCICVLAAAPLLTCKVEAVYQILYQISPHMAQFFMPVHKTDIQNGIKMEVVSVGIGEDMAQVYLSMQDLEGDRVDETMDLYDSYSLNCPFNHVGNCQFLGYEDETGKASFLVSIEWEDGASVEGDKITFSVKEFLSHKKSYEEIEIPVDLEKVALAAETQSVIPVGRSGAFCEMEDTGNRSRGEGREYHASEAEESVTVLASKEGTEVLEVEGIELTGIGYVDGMLHIQTGVKDHLENDNHGSFFLKDSGGETLECVGSYSFVNHYESEGRITYCEYVFEVPREKVGEYTLYGDFITAGMKTEGNWQVTFPLK